MRVPAESSCPPPRACGAVRLWVPLALVFVAILARPTHPQECLECHEEAQPARLSAHATLDCARCHLQRGEYPHPDTATTRPCSACHSIEADQTALGVHGQERRAGNEGAPDCGVCHGSAHEMARPGTTPFRRATVDGCGRCHAAQAEEFRESVHGQAITAGNREAPTCSDCHGEHAIQRPSDPDAATHPRRIRETCAHCHGDLPLMSRFGLPTDRVVSFDASFHGLAVRAGSQSVASCGSCHGVHNILPSTHPRSTIHPANLPATCGACHPGAGSRFALGPVHVLEGRGQTPVADLIRSLYLVLIPLVVGMMFLHNLGDWLRQTRARLRAGAPAAAPALELRMLPAERWQHGLLAVSFVTLTWTGFALKFPDALWAYPLVVWEPSWPVRGAVHRGAAVVFVATAALHLVTLVRSRRLREHWRHLLPRRADVTDALAGFCYNIGLRRRAPAIPSHSYIEKAEYWAVVWGGAVMSVSGVILWADDFFLVYAPKRLLDVCTVVHYYEAVLAALAIVVWHLYFVIFDPRVYPMSGAWLTGYGPVRPPAADDAPAAGDRRPADDA
jgi:cytochrome b subunit of formate dehydrogenase